MEYIPMKKPAERDQGLILPKTLKPQDIPKPSVNSQSSDRPEDVDSDKTTTTGTPTNKSKRLVFTAVDRNVHTGLKGIYSLFFLLTLC